MIKTYHYYNWLSGDYLVFFTVSFLNIVYLWRQSMRAGIKVTGTHFSLKFSVLIETLFWKYVFYDKCTGHKTHLQHKFFYFIVTDQTVTSNNNKNETKNKQYSNLHLTFKLYNHDQASHIFVSVVKTKVVAHHYTLYFRGYSRRPTLQEFVYLLHFPRKTLHESDACKYL